MSAASSWDDPPRTKRRVIAMRFEVDEPDQDLNQTVLERLAQSMEAHAVIGARFLGGVVRDRRLFVDRRGDLREIAPITTEE